MRTIASLAALFCLTAIPGRLLAQSCYVVDKSGNRIRGDALVANEAGDLQLKIGEAVRTFKAGTYRYGYVPKPRQVDLLEKAFEQQRYDMVKEKAPEIFEAYKHLGWGGLVAYFEGQACLAEGKAAEALQKFEAGERFAGPHADAVSKGKASAYLELGRDKEAAELLAKLKAAAGDDVAAFAFLASGKLLQKDGRTKEAVLEYLKTVLLFAPGAGFDVERRQAKEAAVALLKEMGDPRYEQIAQIP
jgi:tetratricopeptide (TPR) repeat protein